MDSTESLFFGASPPPPPPSSANDSQPSTSLTVPTPGRKIKRNVWASSLSEENQWIHALLSSASSRQSEKHQDSRQHRLEGVNDFRDIMRKTPFTDINYDNYDEDKRNDVRPNCIRNTEIPQIIHFIWLGPGPIPSFPFLPQSSSGKDESDSMHEAINSKKSAMGGRSPKLLWNECMSSWKMHHSPVAGWKIHLWTENDVVDDSVPRMETNSYHSSFSSSSSPSGRQFQLTLSQMKNSAGYQHAIRNQNYGMASDILRLEILNVFGGLYVDVDYWCVESLNDIIGEKNEVHVNNVVYAEGNIEEQSQGAIFPSLSSSLSSSSLYNEATRSIQFFCGASNAGCIELNNGLVGCRKGGHPILWNMMDSICNYFENAMFQHTAENVPLTSMLSSFLDSSTMGTLKYMQQSKLSSSMEVIENTGPGLLTRSVCRWLVRNADDKYGNTIDEVAETKFCVSQVVVFPSLVFHPFPNHLQKKLSTLSEKDAKKSILESFVVSGHTKAVHLWGCSWQKD